jgi:hypothetical protein
MVIPDKTDMFYGRGVPPLNSNYNLFYAQDQAGRTKACLPPQDKNKGPCVQEPATTTGCLPSSRK